ncbi:MAG: PP0621 family protein [Candidatus Binatia bacterium]
MILRLLIFFLFVYLLFLLIHSLLSGGRRRQNLKQPPSESGEEMVLDPQCQSYVPKEAALFRRGHYFCSEECARAFLSR